MTPEEWEALYVTMHRLEMRWKWEIPDATVFHAYDPLPLGLFLPPMRVAMEHARGKRFLDLGCGIGTKLAFMQALGWEVSGVDRWLGYVKAAREMMPETEIIHADIRELAELPADVIYMYRPARSDELEAEIETHVVKLMEPGMVLFLPARDGMGLGLESLGPEVWRK